VGGDQANGCSVIGAGTVNMYLIKKSYLLLGCDRRLATDDSRWSLQYPCERRLTEGALVIVHLPPLEHRSG